MTGVLQRKDALLTGWTSASAARAVASLVGEEPRHIQLDRVHFPGKRPVQLNFSVTRRSGQVVAVFAEHCPGDTEAHARRVTASLMKSRNGQRAGLARSRLVADPETGLVLRLPGLDERLPGLRLLYEPGAAQATMADLTGGDPGSVAVRLVSHRLGKRAVLRITSRSGVVYARLRAVKSGDGAERLARHHALWHAFGSSASLRIPQPLGAASALGLSLVGTLQGQPADFRGPDCDAIARALAAFRAGEPEGLPAHRGTDEALLLEDWHDRCRLHLPRFADALAPRLRPFLKRLASHESDLRPCHRDLHEKQILIADGVAGILDFDTASLADPALDSGNLLAHLFLAGYDDRPLRAALDRPGVALWRQAALFRLAMIYAFTSIPDAAVHRLLDEASSHDRD